MLQKERKLLIFTLGDESYAADIMEVERILGYERPTPLPEVPEFIQGVMNYEGNILPVVSLSKKFNLPFIESLDNKIIVVKEKDSKIGIVVNQVSEVITLKESEIDEPPSISSGISKRYIIGLLNRNERIVIFLNLSEVLSEQEKEQFIGE